MFIGTGSKTQTAHPQRESAVSYSQCRRSPHWGAVRHTAAEETHHACHDNETCTEGKKIATKHRVDTDCKPVDGHHCQVCLVYL